MRVTKTLELIGHRTYYWNQYGNPSSEPEKPSVKIKIENTEARGLGKPLPRGIIRLYKSDSRGTAQFIGEDRISHTAKGDDVNLTLGQSFDVSAKRRQTSFRQTVRVLEGAKLTDRRSSHEIVLRNAKNQPVQVIVKEPIYGNWSITEENMPHRKEDAFTAVWTVTVPAEGETKLTYSVLTTESR